MAGLVDGVYHVWTTADECAYLDGIGSHRDGVALRSAARVAALDRYLASMRHRERWDGLDREAIRAHAELLRAAA